MVPSEAAAPALFFVGFLMMSQVVHVNWEDPEEGIPAFLTIVLMPFTYSITVGIGAGFITYALIKAIRGKAKDVHPLLWGVAAAFVLYFAPGHHHRPDRLTWSSLSREPPSDWTVAPGFMSDPGRVQPASG